MMRIAAIAAAALLVPALAPAYPGGTPNFQTDAAPFCAACHSSRDAAALEGAGERAEKETAERKHLSVVLSGQGGYETLGPVDRQTLAQHIRALDEASTVVLEAPAAVARGAEFTVTVRVTGGAGPAVGVALVDRAHRWFARPATSAGWHVTSPPQIMSNGKPASEWLARRPAEYGRALTYVNVPGVSSDAASKRWASATVVYTLRAPLTAGVYPLAAAFLYGTEKATVLGYTTTALGEKNVRGGFDGGSGRVLFTPVKEIRVQ